MNHEDTVIEDRGNVFADLGYPNAEEQQTKAKLVSQIAKLIERQGLTQTETAIRLGIDQPRFPRCWLPSLVWPLQLDLNPYPY
jgi:predicted XRE-type DNA-binding protein